VINSANAALLALRPFTVTRTRGFLHVESDQVAGDESYQVALGCCVVSDQASAIGVTAVPTPFTDLGSDLWFVHEILASSFEILSAVGVETATGVFARVDSKAMRRVEEGQDVLTVIENSSLGSGSSVNFAGRSLIKLH